MFAITMTQVPFKIVNAAGGEHRIEITGEIGWWRTNGLNFTETINNLIQKGVKDVTIYINSPGGSVFDANEIINQIKRLEGKKKAMLGALCASAGTLIASSLDEVVAHSNTMYMIHDVSMMVLIEHESDFDSNKELYTSLTNNAIALYEKKSKQGAAKITEMMRNTTWMSAKKAKEMGFVDAIIEEDDNYMPEDAAMVFGKMKIKVPETLQLSSPTKKNMEKILAKLGLPKSATEDEAVAAIESLVTHKNTATQHAITLLAEQAKNKCIKVEVLQKIAAQDLATAIELVDSQPVSQSSGGQEPVEQTPTNSARLSDLIAEIKQNAGQATQQPVKKFSEYAKENPGYLKNLAMTNRPAFVALFKAEYGIEPNEEMINNAI